MRSIIYKYIKNQIPSLRFENISQRRIMLRAILQDTFYLCLFYRNQDCVAGKVDHFTSLYERFYR